jgi:hypothetical protein
MNRKAHFFWYSESMERKLAENKKSKLFWWDQRSKIKAARQNLQKTGSGEIDIFKSVPYIGEARLITRGLKDFFMWDSDDTGLSRRRRQARP